ncbi:MAG: hypothetical protein ACRDNS_22485, partial [Trebonia sp.]
MTTNLPPANNLTTGLQDGDSYYVTTSGTDNSNPGGNVEPYYTAVRASTFTVDLTGPDLNFTQPADGSIISSLSQIRGTATDALSGISYSTQVYVSLSENGPGAGCWNGQVAGGTFTAAACATPYYPISNLAIGGTFAGGVWSFNMPPLTSQYGYKALIKGQDNATPVGNFTAPANIKSITFTYNTNLPSIGITYPPSLPAAGGNLSAAFTVSGTASDNFGVAYTSVAFQEVDTGNFYDPLTSTFSSVTQKFIGASFSGTAPNYTWSLAAPVPAASSGRSYNILPYVENTSHLSVGSPVAANAITIKWDTTNPASAVSVPANGTYASTFTTVSGTASDPGASSSGVGGTQLQIKRDSTNDCWTGAAWTPSCATGASWLPAAAGTNWSVNSGLPPVSNLNTGLQDGLD